MKKFLTKTEQQTLNLGKKLAKKFRGGEVLALQGDLGAGKTVLTKGIAQGLGVKKMVTSPTFILMNIYPIKTKLIKQLIHIDCYRVKNAQEISDIGAEQYFGRPDTVVVVEWAEKIKKILPKHFQTVDFKIKPGNRREVKIK